MKGIYKYTDLKTGEIVYIGKDSRIHKNQRHRDHLNPSKYDEQPFNRIIQNNPNRYEYGVIWATEDCTTLKLNKMEILFGKIYDPKFNFEKFGKGGALKGEKNPNYGNPSNWKPSEEHKERISEANSGENNPNYGNPNDYHHSEEIKKKICLSTNTTGYLNVSKHKNKRLKQGFAWRYTYYEDGKQKNISSTDLNKLEQKVKAKGLKWEYIK